MSKKRTTYSAEFKSKLVLELLENEKTIAEIANKNNITPKKPSELEKNILGKCCYCNGASKSG